MTDLLAFGGWIVPAVVLCLAVARGWDLIRELIPE